MDVAVAVALIFASFALATSIGAFLLAIRGGGTGAAGGGSETLHRNFSIKLDQWIRVELFSWMNQIHTAVKTGNTQNLPDHPGITDPPTPPGGGE